MDRMKRGVTWLVVMVVLAAVFTEAFGSGTARYLQDQGRLVLQVLSDWMSGWFAGVFVMLVLAPFVWLLVDWGWFEWDRGHRLIVQCGRCDGSGVLSSVDLPGGGSMAHVECPACVGSGWVPARRRWGRWTVEG